MDCSPNVPNTSTPMRSASVDRMLPYTNCLWYPQKATHREGR